MTSIKEQVAVPRRIFQTWKEKQVTNTVLKGWQSSWKETNPTYEYELWDDNDNRAFVEAYFPEMLETYNSYDKEIYRADVIRYMYLYTYGGVYADLDFTCLRSFEAFIGKMEEKGVDVVFGSLGDMDNKEWVHHNIPNAIMISTAKAGFWKFVIDALIKTKVKTLPPEIQTGPVFIKMCVSAYVNKNVDVNLLTSVYGCDIFDQPNADYSSNICITEHALFYPINWDNAKHTQYRSRLYDNDELRVLFPSSLAVTFWMHSW